MSERHQDEIGLWTPANIVTVTRILLVPLFVVAFITPWPQWVPFWSEAALWQPWIAAALFALLSCTDAVDGYLARSRNEVTNFGKFVDPLADKILVAAALLSLVEMQILPSWIAIVILAREFIVSGLRMVAAAEGAVIAASWYGKAKTVFQIVAILLFITKDSPVIIGFSDGFGFWFGVLSWIVMLIAVALTIISMCDYFLKSSHVLGFKPAPAPSGDVTADAANVREAACEVVAKAQEAGCSLSTAESCTGGLIAGALTSIPGSSAVVEGGVVSYSNEVKMAALDVSGDDLKRVGAVSGEVAAQMAQGSRKACGSDIAVSVTGIAGPGGAVPGKPVGTVWFGVASRLGIRTECRHFPGDRDSVRQQTVLHALDLLKEEIEAL